MKIETKREAVKGLYSGEKWKTKVDNMTDEQVTEMYTRLKAQGKV